MNEEFKTLSPVFAVQAQNYSEKFLDKRDDNVNARAMVIAERIIPMLGDYLYNPCITLKEMATIIERELKLKTSAQQAAYAMHTVNQRPGPHLYAMYTKPDSNTRKQNCYFPNVYLHTFRLALGALIEEAKLYDTSEQFKTAKIRVTYESYTRKDVEYAITKFSKDFGKYFRVTPFKETEILVVDKEDNEIYQPGLECLISKSKFYQNHFLPGEFNRLVDATNCYVKLYDIQKVLTNLFDANPKCTIYNVKDLKKEIAKEINLKPEDITITDIEKALHNANISYRYEVSQSSFLEAKVELIILEDIQ